MKVAGGEAGWKMREEGETSKGRMRGNGKQRKRRHRAQEMSEGSKEKQ